MPKKQPPQQLAVNAPINLTEDLYDSADAMAILKCSRNTLGNWRKLGLLPYSPVRRKIYYLKHDVLALLKKNRVGG